MAENFGTTFNEGGDEIVLHAAPTSKVTNGGVTHEDLANDRNRHLMCLVEEYGLEISADGVIPCLEVLKPF